MKKQPKQPRSDVKKGDTMQDSKKAQEMYTQSSGRVVEAMTVWSEANQRGVRELAELSATAAKEGVRLCAELQQARIEALREAQAAAMRWHSGWQETPRDPFAWYHCALAEGMENTQKWFRMLESGAQSVTRSAERLQTGTEQAGKGIQESFTEAVTRLRDVYAAAA